jgi:hypothetical protein
MKSFRLGLAAFTAFALVFLPVSAGDEDEAAKMENADVLRKLTDYDSIFMSGFAVSGTQQADETMVVDAPPLRAVKRRWKLTFGGDRVAYRTDITDYVKPKYQDFAGSEASTDEEKTIRLALQTRQWGYWGDDVSGDHLGCTVLALKPTGEVAEEGMNYTSRQFEPRDMTLIAPKRVLLWSLGRFFAKQLDKVTRVEKAADGRLLIAALGTQSPGYKGRWELEIDPAAAWMVRRARFYWNGAPDRMRAEMKNDGTVWSGPHCIPKEAACNYWGSLDEFDAVHLTFEPVVEPFDDKLYAEAQQAVVHNKTPALIVMDYRVSPPTVSEPNKPAPTHTSSRPRPASSALIWFLLANLVLIVVVGFCMWWRLRKAP